MTHQDLAALRKSLDDIDAVLVSALGERARLARQICAQHTSMNGYLPLIALSARWEQACRCRAPACRHPAPPMHPHDRDSLPCHWPRRWDEAARGAGRAHDGAGVCVRSCNHVCRGGFSTDTSMRSVSHTSYGVCRERAALHAAVPDALVHGRPGDAPVLLPCCCRRRRGDTDYSRASGACSAQTRAAPRQHAALLVKFGMADAHQRVSHHQAQCPLHRMPGK
mgnify:CR=1 FL=1